MTSIDTSSGTNRCHLYSHIILISGTRPAPRPARPWKNTYIFIYCPILPMQQDIDLPGILRLADVPTVVWNIFWNKHEQTVSVSTKEPNAALEWHLPITRAHIWTPQVTNFRAKTFDTPSHPGGSQPNCIRQSKTASSPCAVGQWSDCPLFIERPLNHASLELDTPQQ